MASPSIRTITSPRNASSETSRLSRCLRRRFRDRYRYLRTLNLRAFDHQVPLGPRYSLISDECGYLSLDRKRPESRITSHLPRVKSGNFCGAPFCATELH